MGSPQRGAEPGAELDCFSLGVSGLIRLNSQTENHMPAKSSSTRQRQDGQVRPGLLRAIRLLTLAAMGISAYLAWNYYTGGRAMGCGPESGCDKVLQSRWAKWFEAPVSLFALAVYSLILGASFRLRQRTPPEVQRKAWAWLVACALIVAGAALWFTGLQVFALKAVCSYCMAAHACGFVAAVLLLVSAPFRSAPAKPWESEKQVYVTPRTLRNCGLIIQSCTSRKSIGV